MGEETLEPSKRLDQRRFMGCAQSDIPPPTGYGTATQRVLSAQIGEAPQLYSAEAQYEPLLAQLTSNDSLASMNNMLYGSNGQQGQIADQANANTAARGANISDLTNLGPQALQSLQATNPAMFNLLNQLNQSASAGLSAGSSLTPDQQRAMQQQSRAAFAARGTTGDNGSISDELLRQFNLGQQLLTQRQGFAQGMIGTNMGATTDPMLQILGQGSNTLGMAGGSDQGAGFSLFNPNAGLGMIQSNDALLAQEKAANPTALSGVMQIAGAVDGGLSGVSKAM